MCRMVRDNFKRTVEQNQKENHAAETQSQTQPGGEPAQSVGPESQEPTETQHNLQYLHKLNFEEEPETWHQPLTTPDGDCLPTHLRPFTSQEEYKLVKTTYRQLLHSGYYWGPMTMEEAHEILTQATPGTFLIRDSGQPDVFFTLSYQSDDGPTSVRVQLNNLLFSLHGSQRTFPSLFDLLTYYTGSSCKLTAPYRRQRPEGLKQMCRRALLRTCGAQTVSTLPRVSTQMKDYLQAYPHCI